MISFFYIDNYYNCELLLKVSVRLFRNEKEYAIFEKEFLT